MEAKRDGGNTRVEKRARRTARKNLQPWERV